MSILCKLFGHRFGVTGWWGDGLYGRPVLSGYDNLGTLHFKVVGTCERCKETTTMARFHHQPVLDTIERLVPRQSTTRVQELLEANTRQLQLRREATELIHRSRELVRQLPEDLNLAFLADSEEFLAEALGEKPRYAPHQPRNLD